MAEGAKKRLVRNFLLEPRFQLKFVGYLLAVTILVAAALGTFLWKTTRTLMDETKRAVDARSRMVEMSKEVQSAVLSNELMKRLNDPAFEKVLQKQSKVIDEKYETEKEVILEQRALLVAHHHATMIALVTGLLAFIILMGLAAIVATHRVAGPLYRIKRLAEDVADGRAGTAVVKLREGDELQDVFEALAQMVDALKAQSRADATELDAISRMAGGGNAQLTAAIETLRRKVVGRGE